MTKKITKRIKVLAPAGKATPAPPLGPTLGQAGINIGDFVTKFNAATKDSAEEMVTAHINVYEDRTYDFKVMTPPTSGLILKAAKVRHSAYSVSGNKIKTCLTLLGNFY